MLRFLGFLFTAGFIVFVGVAIGAGYIIWETTKTLPEQRCVSFGLQFKSEWIGCVERHW